MKKSLTIILFFILSGCAIVRMEHNGVPLPDNVINARLLKSDISVTSVAIQQRGVPEGDEILKTYKYLDFNKFFPKKNLAILQKSPKGGLFLYARHGR